MHQTISTNTSKSCKSFWFVFRSVQVMASWTMRGMFFAGSFHRVKVSGRQVSSKEAPILVLAPHSSFFDSITVVLFGPPSVLAKAETAFLPFFGSKSLQFVVTLFPPRNNWSFPYFRYRIDQLHSAHLRMARRSKFTTKYYQNGHWTCKFEWELAAGNNCYSSRRLETKI